MASTTTTNKGWSTEDDDTEVFDQADLAGTAFLDLDASLFASGVTGSRPASPDEGDQYVNTTLDRQEWYDGAAWRQNIDNKQYTAKGILLSASAASAIAAVSIGSNNALLVADSAQSAGMKWSSTLAGLSLTSPTITGSPTAAGATWADLGTVTAASFTAATVTTLTATSIVIGANTITTLEWAFLDGLNQAVATTSSPTFANLTITSFAADWTNAGRTIADLGVVTTVDLNGGTIDGAIIGGASAAAATFTTINTSGDVAIGAIADAQQAAIGLTDVLARLRERDEVNALGITTNDSDGGVQDDATKPSWKLRLSSGAADNLLIARKPAAGAFATLLTLSSTGQLTLPGLGAFVASDKYLVIDASGNVHISALGPAS